MIDHDAGTESVHVQASHGGTAANHLFQDHSRTKVRVHSEVAQFFLGGATQPPRPDSPHLIDCPHCGRPWLSRLALLCPSCGFDIRSWARERRRQEVARWLGLPAALLLAWMAVVAYQDALAATVGPQRTTALVVMALCQVAAMLSATVCALSWVHHLLVRPLLRRLVARKSLTPAEGEA